MYLSPSLPSSDLSVKGIDWILIRYETVAKSYQIWNPVTKKIVVSWAVIFDKNIFSRSTTSYQPQFNNSVLLDPSNILRPSTNIDYDYLPHSPHEIQSTSDSHNSINSTLTFPLASHSTPLFNLANYKLSLLSPPNLPAPLHHNLFPRDKEDPLTV